MGWEPGLKSLKLNENKRSWKLTLVADEIMMGRIFEDSFFLCQTLRVELPVRPTIWVTIHLFLVNNRKLLCNSYRRLQNHFCSLNGPKNSHTLHPRHTLHSFSVELWLCTDWNFLQEFAKWWWWNVMRKIVFSFDCTHKIPNFTCTTSAM